MRFNEGIPEHWTLKKCREYFSGFIGCGGDFMRVVDIQFHLDSVASEKQLRRIHVGKFVKQIKRKARKAKAAMKANKTQ